MRPSQRHDRRVDVTVIPIVECSHALQGVSDVVKITNSIESFRGDARSGEYSEEQCMTGCAWLT